MLSWISVESNVRQKPCHVDIRIEKHGIRHPSLAGFYLSTGEPKGQNADYRKCLQDSTSLHVREFDDYYLAHWDNYDPSVSFIGHLLVDAPHWVLVIGTIGIIGIVGLSFITES